MSEKHPIDLEGLDLAGTGFFRGYIDFLRSGQDALSTSVSPHGVESSLDNGMPSVSVDRAAVHLINSLEMDVEGSSRFYDALPIEDRISLSEVVVHYSAASPVEKVPKAMGGGWDFLFGEFIFGGASSVTHEDLHISEPMLGYKPLIVVYLGSAYRHAKNISDNEAEFQVIFNDHVNAILKHELTHLARDLSQKEKISAAQSFAIKQLHRGEYLIDRVRLNSLDLAAGGVGTLVAESATDASGLRASMVGAVVCGLSRLTAGARRLDQRGMKNAEKYDNDVDEQEAQRFERIGDDIISVFADTQFIFPAEYGIQDLTKNKGNTITRRLRKRNHRDLSFTPRGEPVDDVNLFKKIEIAKRNIIEKRVNVMPWKLLPSRASRRPETKRLRSSRDSSDIDIT